MQERGALGLVALSIVMFLTAVVGGCAFSKAGSVVLDRDGEGKQQGGDVVSFQTTTLTPAIALSSEKKDIVRQEFTKQGTGKFVRPVSKSLQSLPSGEVGLNLLNVSVKDAADVILKDTLGLSYLIDQGVSGTITARTAKPISKEALLKTFETILATNGLSLLKGEDFYRIAILSDAEQQLPRVNNFQASEGYGIYVIPLRYVSASGLLDVLPSLKQDSGGHVSADVSRNVLIFSGSSVDARNLADLVDTFDVDWMSGMSFALEPLVNSEPETVKAEVDDILSLQAGPLKGLVRLVAIKRLQALLIISSQPRYISQVRSWVNELDRAGGGNGRQLYVYSVKNARASDLSMLLNQVFEGSSQRDFHTGDVAPSAEKFELGSSGEVSHIAPIDDGENTRVGNLKIIANESSNSLLLLAYPHEYRILEKALDRLDVMPLQVMIEATIAEVTLNDELKYGLQWLFSSGDSSFTFSALSNGSVSSSFPGFSYSLAGASANVVLNALSQITNVNVISSPQLMVLDNETARLQVGDQVPVATQSAVSTDSGGSPIVNSIEFKDTGVILDVTPRVTAAGTVVLNVSQEVSDVVETTTSDIDSPTIQQRQISSSIAVRGGETVALGGLIKSKDTDGVSGIPVLSDIPLFGNFFKTTSRSKVRTELLVLITPKVIRNPDESRAVTLELRQRMSQLNKMGL